MPPSVGPNDAGVRTKHVACAMDPWVHASVCVCVCETGHHGYQSTVQNAAGRMETLNERDYCGCAVGGTTSRLRITIYNVYIYIYIYAHITSSPRSRHIRAGTFAMASTPILLPVISYKLEFRVRYTHELVWSTRWTGGHRSIMATIRTTMATTTNHDDGHKHGQIWPRPHASMASRPDAMLGRLYH